MPVGNYQYVVLYTSTVNYNVSRQDNGCVLALANGAISVDGVTPVVGDVILLKDQADQSFNGIYEVIVVGNGATKFKLKRTNLSLFAKSGSTIYTKAGVTNVFLLYVFCLIPDPFTLDVDNVDVRLVTDNSALGPEVECRVTYWNTATTISSDGGLLWDPAKNSFTAGEATGSQWDKANRGTHSQGFGINTQPIGNFSLAGGEGTEASGASAFSFGETDSGGIIRARGDGSFAEGYSGGNGIIQTGTSADGSIARGWAGSSGTIQTGTSSSGSFAWGWATNGTIETNTAAQGALARGYVDGGGSVIVAIGDGAAAAGYTTGSTSITASGRGSHAEGSTLEDSILASAEGSRAEGTDTEASGVYSHASGASSHARLRAQQALASGHNFGAGLPDARGNAQCCDYVVRNRSADATPIQLFLDGNTGTLLLTIEDQTSWAFCVYVVARGICNPGESFEHADAAYRLEGLITRDDVNTTLLMLGLSVTTIFESGAASNFSVTALAATNALIIQVTGDVSCDVRWVGCVKTTEVMLVRVADSD